MRGGTSKAVFLREDDLPAPGEARDRMILKVFGSPDKRQIDGLGGADPLTSKLAIIGAPRMAGIDVTYTFGQVEIDRPHVDYHSLCGNISAAVGHYAVEAGLVEPVEPVTRVTAWTTNLKRRLTIEVPVRNGRPVRTGSYRVPGVPGTGARILLDFADTAGGATGSLLPTGNPLDALEVPGIGRIEVSLVDIGNAHVFIRARDVGLLGTESPAEIDGDRDLLARLERIRAAGAVRMGMASSIEAAVRETPATPILGIVSPPAASRWAAGRGRGHRSGVARHVHADHAQDLCRDFDGLHRRRGAHPRQSGGGHAAPCGARPGRGPDRPPCGGDRHGIRGGAGRPRAKLRRAARHVGSHGPAHPGRDGVSG
jgi:hypothetical protein